MSKIICERCGKEIKETSLGKVFYKIEYGYVNISKVAIIGDHEETETVRYEFCRDCMKSYFDWLARR
jgi:hypothetical protein